MLNEKSNSVLLKGNLTTGPLFIKILLFSLPIILTNMLQAFYNAADIIVVGLSKEADAVGAIGSTGSFVSCAIYLNVGFAVGVNVVVAFFLGKGDKIKTSKSVHTSLITSLFVGIFCGIIGIILSNPIMKLLGEEGRLLELSTLYCIVYFCGVPFISLTNSASAVFRSFGDTKTPLIVLAVSGILNVLLNLFFVLVLNMAVEGVAIATAISNAFSAFVLIFLLTRVNNSCRVDLKKLKIDKESFIRIMKTGIPASIQGMLFSVSNMIIQSSIIAVNNSLVPIDSAYQPVVKGNAAVTNLEAFVYAATQAIGQAAVTFTSQNLGAEKFDRIKTTAKYCYLIAMIFAIVLSGIAILIKDPLLSLYGIVNGEEGSLENIAYNTALARVRYMFYFYCFINAMETGCGLNRGLGYSTVSTVVSLIGSVVLRIIWIYTGFKALFTLDAIYVSYPVSWFITALIHFCCFIFLFKKIKKRTLLNN